jgi:DNA mismatch repair protein MutL
LRRADAHRILHTGTSALLNGKAEPRCLGIKTLFLDERVELRGCACGEFDHILFLGTIWHEVKWAREESENSRGFCCSDPATAAPFQIMGKIRLLPDDVASQVAAGEVVERPASLVKELVENSLDAGARRIWVDFAGGGSRFVSVRDDGCGMDREDALLCLERHATSKIRSAADLARVRSMGFRGEALPSIASVSRFRLATREASSEAGTEVIVAGGKVEAVREIGVPAGTHIKVRDVFYNLPARRRFLRGEETESAHIVHGLHGIALANPSVAFECRRDGFTIAALPRAESLAVRIRDLFGSGHLAKLLNIEVFEGDRLRLSGFVARPGQGRRDRLQQFVILNGRPVHCPAVQQALREAYVGVIERGEHPICVLHIEMDLEYVDCNVHPSKREVRLRRPEVLQRAVFDATRSVLVRPRENFARNSQPVRAEAVFVPEPPQTVIPLPKEATTPRDRNDAAPPEPERFRFVGIIGDGYLVLEGDEGLVLLDTRAAAERILFESLMRQIADGNAPSQRLLIPAVVDIPPREHAWVIDHLEDLRVAGFFIEPFGGTALKIEGLPASAAGKEPGRLLHEVAAVLRAAGRLPHGRDVREAVARSVSHLASAERIPADEAHAGRLVGELLRCDLPYASPSGRPTMIQFSFAELDRKFGRAN